MALCGCGVVVAVAIAGRRLGFGFGTLAFVALSPLAIGSVILTRFDLWPAMLASFALAALVHDRYGSATACSARRSRRSSIRPSCFRSPSRTCGVGAGGERGSSARRSRSGSRCLPTSRSRVARARGSGAQRRAPAVAAAPDREPRLRDPARGARPLRDRRRGGLEPRLAEPRRNQRRRARRRRSRSRRSACSAWLWLRFARSREPPSPAALAVNAAAALTAFVALGKVLSPAVPDLARPGRRPRPRARARTRCSPLRSC